MIKKYLLTTIAFLSVFSLFAQEVEKCGANIVLEQQLQDPKARAKYDAFQEAIQRYTADPSVAVTRSSDGIRIVPVVFHVLHEGGNENISMAKIQEQLDVMNQDFRRLNPDTINTPQRFYGDTEYTHFVFNSDSIHTYVDTSSYAMLSNRYGESFAFHFNNAAPGLPDTIADLYDLSDSLKLVLDTVIEVSVFGLADTSEIATAFRNSINAQNGLMATYSNNGNHRVDVSTDGLGYVDDVLLAGLWNITALIDQQGTYLPADSKVEFRLATKDPLGNCTDGVVRVFTSKTNDANNGTGFKAESYWNAYSYLNIWTVANFNLGQQGVIGFAQFPNSGSLSTDGVALIANTVGGANSGGRAAMHEIGHWLSLIHIWGDAECGSDNVLDTPVHFGPNGGVCGNAGMPNYTTPYNPNGCGLDNPDGEMFNNYMDYSSGQCQNMFTLGQKARMDFTFEGDGEESGFRANMISQANLELTGTADPYTPSDCAPISAFYFRQNSSGFATQRMICVGETVDFEETAYNGDVDDYLWTFEGGDPATDDSANPNNIDYNTPGRFDVTLEVSNAVGSNSKTATDMIIVSATTAQNQSDWGYVDSFWDEQAFLDEYVVFNQDGSTNGWEYFNAENGGYSGWGSVRMFNIDNKLEEIDELVSPSYDLSNLNSPTLQYRYSGAAIDNTPNDELKIMVSDDCGESWQTRETFSGFDLINAGLVSNSYRPNANSTWSNVSVGLGSFGNKPNVRIKFRWISGGRGNNFFIDDVTLSSSPLGMEDLERQLDLNVAPNPTSNATTVTMNLPYSAKIRMEVMDVLGRDSKTILSKEMSKGTHNFDVNLSNHADGVYYLRILVDSNMVVKKIVKN